MDAILILDESDEEIRIPDTQEIYKIVDCTLETPQKENYCTVLSSSEEDDSYHLEDFRKSLFKDIPEIAEILGSKTTSTITAPKSATNKSTTSVSAGAIPKLSTSTTVPVAKLSAKTITASKTSTKTRALKINDHTKKRDLNLREESIPKELKRIKKNSILEMLLVIDAKLIQEKPEIIDKLQEMNCKTSFKEVKVKGTIECRRFFNNINLNDTDLDFSLTKLEYVILKWSAIEFVALIHQNMINKVIDNIEISYRDHPPKQIMIVVEGIEQYMKSNISSANRAYKMAVESQVKNKYTTTKKKNLIEQENIVNQERFDDTVLELLMEKKCQVIITQNSIETTEYISKFVLKLSQQPYKKPESFEGFCAEASMPKRSAKTPQECWVAQLEQIQSISKVIAEEIVKAYPTVRSLLSLYSSNALSEVDKKELLQEIRLPNGRRIGPAISEKIFRFFTETDGSKIL